MLNTEYFEASDDKSTNRQGIAKKMGEWAFDAINIKGNVALSHQKMEFEKNMRHPRKNISGEYEPFAITEDTGNLGVWN